jgi:asparagine synthase (glutamine-hydrolysing)
VIKADIALHDLSLSPSWRDGSVVMGRSALTPYAHRLLEACLVVTTDRWFLVVRERQAGVDGTVPRHGEAHGLRQVDEETFHNLYQQCVLWPLDYLMIEVARVGCRLRVRAGMLGSVPVYCRATDDRVSVSWDSADFTAHPSLLDTEVVSHRLAMHTAYSARQPYSGVIMMTERASLHLEPGKAHFRYPEPVPPSVPRQHTDGQDELPAFEAAVRRSVAARPAGAHASVELSGGMDSATVATALRAAGVPLASKGILLEGDVRDTQVQRRTLIVDRLGLADTTVDIAALPPDLDLASTANGAHGFYREFYLEACMALWSSARSEGRDTLFTGVGGDELFPAYAGETAAGAVADPAWVSETATCAERLLTPRAAEAARSLRSFDAPAGPVPMTSLLANACRAPDMLRHGQWPVSPLSDPHLVAFCHRLPRASRRGRDVMRRYLQSQLGADVFPPGYSKETFVHVLPPLIARHAPTLSAQLAQCALADLGLVDPQAVRALLDDVVRTRSHGATSALANFLWLERFARQTG